MHETSAFRLAAIWPLSRFLDFALSLWDLHRESVFM
jgi:hypothetical protein